MLRLLLVVSLLLAACSGPQSPADTMQAQMPTAPPKCEGQIFNQEAQPSTAIASGAPAFVVIRCTGSPQVVDVLVTVPPPLGGLGMLTAQAAEVDGRPVWLAIIPPVPVEPGTVVSVYVITDGRPERAPVVFTVQ